MLVLGLLFGGLTRTIDVPNSYQRIATLIIGGFPIWRVIYYFIFPSHFPYENGQGAPMLIPHLLLVAIPMSILFYLGYRLTRKRQDQKLTKYNS